jgi:hypothetical protein
MSIRNDPILVTAFAGLYYDEAINDMNVITGPEFLCLALGHKETTYGQFH